MLILHADEASRLAIRPRWPSRCVLVEECVYTALVDAQSRAPHSVRLVLTRGFEPRASLAGRTRRLSRIVGKRVFRLLYPRRRSEIEPIFGANGHDVDGTHVDVSVALDGRVIRFLPLGVFTPVSWQRRCVDRHADALQTVWQLLIEVGFSIHGNPTESLQIHCDYRLLG
ncbi:hypothetical protein D8770_07855 [Methylobacterium sp. DB1607]|nr:hypothetical protein [Methylobacterium sp. DB1607]